MVKQILHDWDFQNIIAGFLGNFSHSKGGIGNISHSPFISWQFLAFIAFLVVSLLIVRLYFRFKKSIEETSVLLELTPPAYTEKTAYTTQQLFSTIYSLGRYRTFLDKLLGKKPRFSFEIVSTQNQGIRYLIRTTPDLVNNVKRNLLSYLPQVSIKTVNEYLPENFEKLDKFYSKIVEYKLSKPFALPLQSQEVLKEHDPVAYSTGMMTKLLPGELVSFQIVLSPIKTRETATVAYKIRNGEIFEYLHEVQIPFVLKILKALVKVIFEVVKEVVGGFLTALREFQSDAESIRRMRAYDLQSQIRTTSYKPQREYSPYEQEVIKSIQEKINQPLFEASLRLLVVVKDKQELWERVNGFSSSLETFAIPAYQSLKVRRSLGFITNRLRPLAFKYRLLSFKTPRHDKHAPLLSVSEMSDLFHFPYSRVTQTEDIVKIYSKELPAPLSLKKADNLDVIFAENYYAGGKTMIGLSADERRRHMYILGATGTGKSTLLLKMIIQDMGNYKGICVIDPHGELIDKILPYVPANREKDVINFNPFDIGFPIGLNLLELSENLDEDSLLLEKELIAESIISLFHKLYPDKFSGPRMEYILRNTIHTSFTIKGPTLFTVYKLLINPIYRKGVVNGLVDDNLKDFWKYEFGKAGDYQKVKMISPITNKIGRFLFSPSSKRILEQQKSTINFDDIMDSGKILLCNISKGKIGEDNSEVLGILIMTKIQLAALRRAKKESKDRKDFYLYVDEFQNFATPAFAQMLSESRKYALNVILAQQTTSQLENKDLVNIILANTGTVICFRTANPEDELLILPQFKPYIQQGEIANLPWYHFYIKINTKDSQEPFSGETIYVEPKEDRKKVEKVIKLSRERYAHVYVKEVKDDIVDDGLNSGKSIPDPQYSAKYT